MMSPGKVSFVYKTVPIARTFSKDMTMTGFASGNLVEFAVSQHLQSTKPLAMVMFKMLRLRTPVVGGEYDTVMLKLASKIVPFE